MPKQPEAKVTITLKTGRYRYLWLKYVTGFDVARHCARCLIGRYDPAVSATDRTPGRVIVARFDPTVAPFFYLCGVTPSWAENLHVAMRPGSGDFEVEDGNCRVVAEGLERLAIPEDDLPYPRDFATCRNFRFGHHYFGSKIDRPRQTALF